MHPLKQSIKILQVTALFCLALVLLSFAAYSQTVDGPPSGTPQHFPNPFDKDHLGGQHGTFFDKPGKYSLVVTSEETSLERGGALEIQIFITGYGAISNAKLFVMPSIKLVDEEKSKVAIDLKRGDGLNPEIMWGDKQRILRKEGFVVGLHGMGYQSADSTAKQSPTTIFFDAGQPDDEAAPRIMTEIVTGADDDRKSAFTINLVARKDARAGNHKLDFVLTYFDGQQWQNSSYAINVTLKDFWDAHPGIFWLIGTILVFLQLGLQVVPILSKK